VRQLDGDDSVLVYGSDYPQPEGVVTPTEFASVLDGLSEEAQARIMRTNADDIFGPVG
jgi:predicted TIM-barrel fold metal-dependent hydrolase